jgi:hypothetical protein
MNTVLLSLLSLTKESLNAIIGYDVALPVSYIAIGVVGILVIAAIIIVIIVLSVKHLKRIRNKNNHPPQ